MKDLETINISQYGYSILQVETMSVCNMRCRFCAFPVRNDKGEVLPEDIVYSVIDSLRTDDSFEYICFSHFNEPLLDNRIYDFVKYAKDRKLPVLIITNGLMFDSEDVIHKLITANPDQIKISLQTLSENDFCSVRGIDRSFSEYRNGIFEFLKRAYGSSSKISIDIACNFMTVSRKLQSTVFGLERGDPSVYNRIVDLRDDVRSFFDELYNYDNRFNLKNSEIDKYLDKANLDYLYQMGFNITENISLKIKPFMFGKKLTEFIPAKEKEGIGCTNRMLGILASGKVVPCCLAYDDMLTMGNIKEESLRKILEKKNSWLKNIRRGIGLQLVCKRCLGAPTKRGTVMQPIKTKFLNDLSRLKNIK